MAKTFPMYEAHVEYWATLFPDRPPFEVVTEAWILEGLVAPDRDFSGSKTDAGPTPDWIEKLDITVDRNGASISVAGLALIMCPWFGPPLIEVPPIWERHPFERLIEIGFGDEDEEFKTHRNWPTVDKECSVLVRFVTYGIGRRIVTAFLDALKSGSLSATAVWPNTLQRRAVTADHLNLDGGLDVPKNKLEMPSGFTSFSISRSPGGPELPREPRNSRSFIGLRPTHH